MVGEAKFRRSNLSPLKAPRCRVLLPPPHGHVRPCPRPCPCPCPGSWGGKTNPEHPRTFPAPAPPVQDAGDAQDVAQHKGSGWQIGALRQWHRSLFPARYPKFPSPAPARHGRQGEGMEGVREKKIKNFQNFPKVPSCASARSWLRPAELAGTGTDLGAPRGGG